MCEVHCVAGCCGLDAFEVDASHIVPWVREHGLVQTWVAADQLSDQIREVLASRGTVTSDQYEFNHYWVHPALCSLFLSTWQQEIVRAAETVSGQPLMKASWRTETVMALARAIQIDRAFDRLPILADALEDAGCDHPDVLAHCRGPGPHARGCWVVDLVLGKV
jgi:hypothetical protein